MVETLLALAPLLLGGAIAAYLSGLLGIGGGVIITPMMIWYLTAHTAINPELVPRIAVATSLAVITGTAFFGAREHHKNARVDWLMIRRGWLPLILGSLLGSLLISTLPAELAVGSIGIGLLLLGWLQIADIQITSSRQVGRSATSATAAGVGSVSAYMGIGGGVLVMPLLRLAGFSMQKAIGTAGASSCILACSGALYMIVIGMYSNPHISGTLGNIYYPGVLVMWLLGPYISVLGARSLKYYPENLLRWIFITLLLVNASYCLYKAVLWSSA